MRKDLTRNALPDVQTAWPSAVEVARVVEKRKQLLARRLNAPLTRDARVASATGRQQQGEP